LGIPTIGLTFDGPYGVYHSVYDNYYWMNHFGDPGYRYHILCAKVWGLIALRLANADILPLDFSLYADSLRQFVDDLKKTAGVKENLDLSLLLSKIAEFKSEGVKLNKAASAALLRGKLNSESIKKTNEKVIAIERGWLSEEGIPGRPWFKHLLYAARYTYAHLELPALTEAAERMDWDAAKVQAGLLEKAVEANSRLLAETTVELH